MSLAPASAATVMVPDTIDVPGHSPGPDALRPNAVSAGGMQVEYQSQPALSWRAVNLVPAEISIDESSRYTAAGLSLSLFRVGFARLDQTSRTCTRVMPAGHSKVSCAGGGTS